MITFKRTRLGAVSAVLGALGGSCAAPDMTNGSPGGDPASTTDDTGAQLPNEEGSTTDGFDGEGEPSGSGGASSASGGNGNLPGEELLPEEVEDVQDYRIPVATGRYLWSANPESGRVALIDAVGLSVQVLSAGLFPTYITSVPGGEDAQTAVVVNRGSSDVTRFVVRDGEVSQDTVAIHPGANRWVSSEHWAVAWSAPEEGSALDPTEGLQEVTVLNLASETMQAKRLAVGYRPRLLQISADEHHLNVVSAEGIAVIKLDDNPTSDEWIDLGLDAEVLDVSLSADGNYALVRKTDENTVDIIDLRSPSDVAQLSFSGPVTDVDLSPSGRAVVVVRQTRQVASFVLSEVLDDPSKVDTVTLNEQVIGSAVVTSDGKAAIAYTNVVESDSINIVNLEPGDDYLSYRQLSTQSPVYSVVAAPGGAHAMVLAGDGAGHRTNAFSVISLKEARFPRVVGTAGPVQQVAIADDFAIVTAAGLASGYEAHTVRLPELTVNSIKLASAPLSVGALPDFGVGYVAQTHAEGRVTFFDFENNDVSTLTGFELSAEVVDE